MRTLLLALVLIANTAAAQDVVKLSGHIENRLSDTVRISYNDNYVAYFPKEFFATIDKKGNFAITIPVPANIYVLAELNHGNRMADMILKAGDSLVMTVNAQHYDSTVHFTGRGSEAANFTALHTKEKGRLNQYATWMKAALVKEPADFVKIIAQNKKTEMDFLDKNKKGLPASFIKYWTAYYQYYNYFFMEQYPVMHEVMKLKRYTDTIPEINYAVVKDIPYAFNDTLLQVPPYLLYLTGVFDIKLKAAGYGYSGKDVAKARVVEDSVNALAHKKLPSGSGEYFMAQNIYGRAKNEELERTESQLGLFKKYWPESKYLASINKQVVIAERMAPGQPAPDMELITKEDGSSIKLSDLKGKVVYLGFWASWCRQCVGEMISEKKIKDELNGKPVAFVYISIDNDTAADNALCKRYKIDGIHKHAGGGWDAAEIALYGVQGMPAYFLIDEDGKLTMRNPPTPMQATQLVTEINKLVK